MIRSGVFITLEGGEGVGKSTQLGHLAHSLHDQGHDIVVTREPGGTPGAEAIRALMLDPATTLAPLADTFLVYAARADHVASLIRPALARGAIVLCDRFSDSTMAYQGYGMGVDRDVITSLSAMTGLFPDLTLILDAPDGVARDRLAMRGIAPDRYERFDHSFTERVTNGFRAIAASDPARCSLIDAGGDEDAVARAIASVVQERLGT